MMISEIMNIVPTFHPWQIIQNLCLCFAISKPRFFFSPVDDFEYF